MRYFELDTPSLLIDRELLLKNLADMQHYADENKVRLRPHTKTHKMPEIAKLQEEQGACGIAVAKVGEAEVMAQWGLKDIFIANEIVGIKKLERIASLAEKGVRISFGIDSLCQVTEAEKVFSSRQVTIPALIEIEVGENRSGIIREEDFIRLLDAFKDCPHVLFAGIFSHDGNSYHAKDIASLHEIAENAQKRTLRFANLARAHGMPCAVVSYGSTPTFMNHVKILEGITELRPGTYALMDTSQGHAIQTLDRCAATVLATVISRPTDTRTILDVGAKGLTMQERKTGICAASGKGTILEYPGTHIDSVFDEHAILYDRDFHDQVTISDKVRIIPVHICPVCNLYDSAYLVSGNDVVQELAIACRGKLQ
ncbi:MAG: D-TA family PLP-dependent enzyme [Lachnospiraceae bacterium]|nr:D-TA family PLP-dependent enzyme [Lachnospiraceae bacterium]